jgi:hypothetical protein
VLSNVERSDELPGLRKEEMEQSKRTVVLKNTPSLLILLGMMLATLLTVAATAPAQQQAPPAPEVEPPVTGVLEDTGLGDNPGYENPTYGLLDEASGVLVVLESDAYDLSAFLGERVTVDGTLTPADPPGASFPVLDVTYLEFAGPPETATVTFRLTIDGAVPEGRTFSLGYKPIGYLNRDFRGVAFCTTDTEDPEPAPQGAPDLIDETALPICEDGGTYTDTLEVPLDEPFSFDYLLDADRDDVRCDPGRMGPLEVFYSETRTFTTDATISATYVEDGLLPPGCYAVGEDDGGSGNGGVVSGDSNGGSDNGSGGGNVSSSEVGEAGSEPSGGTASTSGVKTLPATGGVTLFALSTGALLVGGGWLIRRLTR